MTFTRSRLAIAVMAVSSGFVYAENQPQTDATLLNQVTVTAARSEKDINDIAQTIEVVDQYQIQQEQPESVVEAVKSLPNVTASGGPRANSQSINIRGLSGTRVLQIVDGARQNFSNGHRGTYFMDPEMLKSIEVVKGPASTLWGSGAIGGVVVQNTKTAEDLLEPGETFGGNVSVGYHSNNHNALTSGSVYGITDNFDWLLNGYYNDSNNYKTGNSDEGKGDAIEHSGTRDQGAMAKLGWQLNDDSRLEFKSQYSETDASVPSNPATGVGSSSPLITQESTTTNLTAAYLFNPENALINSKFQLFYNDTQFDEYRVEKNQRDDTEYKTLGAALINTSELNSLDLTYGLDVYRNTIETKRDDTGNVGNRPEGLDGESTTLGAYVQADIPLANTWTLQTGLRYDRFESEDNRSDSAVTDKKQSDSAASPSVALIWETTDWLTLTASYNEAFRAPGMEEMFSTGTHFHVATPRFSFSNVFVPNPDLKPEEAKNKEISARMNFSNLLGNDELAVTANIFQNDIDNFINQTVGMTTTTWNNVDEARLKGFELVGNYRYENVELGLSYGQTRGKDKKSGDYLENVPADKVVAEIAYLAFQGDIKVGSRYTHVKAQDKVSDSYSGPELSGSYDLIDLYLSYEPATGSLKGIKTDLTVNNLTNEYYRVAWEQLYEPGRNIKLNVRYTF
ncbi:TonB-dependent hemoglobin/transferrin/lactoferrin family receptor [Endozoicomonas arenosclerae]|uniref:TonB-dependent hemoglobin/transferrin/lactoferrin family receptor n=1 Tax=Endozoicomonas arenosclerae TaxID=1633495 RepID=UPI000783FE59|nr:TonB-dependent hemoglobin/transferrin/lactoferrin family receptor [Endozoicomonas arenosclerae]